LKTKGGQAAEGERRRSTQKKRSFIELSRAIEQ